MKKTNRFALLAILGAIMGSALIVGCGGGGDDEGGDTAANTTTNATGDAGEDTP